MSDNLHGTLEAFAVKEMNGEMVLMTRPPDTTWCPNCDSGNGWNYWTRAEVAGMLVDHPDDDLAGFFEDETHTLEDGPHYIYSKCGYCSPKRERRLPVPPCKVADWAFAETAPQ
jgi:hypothetical protein